MNRLSFLKSKNACRTAAVLISVMLAVCIVFGYPVTVSSEETADPDLPYGGEFGPCNIVNKLKGTSVYNSTNVWVLTEEEAVAEGVPEGFTGHVVTANPSSNVGVTFDFTGAGINVYAVRSIAVRVYIEPTAGDITEGDSHYPELRVPYPSKPDAWIVKYDASAKTGRWLTLVMYADGTNMYKDAKRLSESENAFAGIADGDGFLKAFELAVRRQSGKGNFYIDSLIIRYDYDSGKGPEIHYNGPEVVKVAKGAEILLDVYASEFEEKRNVPVKIGWEEGTVLEEDGFPAVGTGYRLVLTASDGFGNTEKMSIKAEVAPPDKTPPVIGLGSGSIKCTAGSRVQVKGTVTDDFAVKSVEYEWQDGAFDSLGRLNEGTFELKVTATDSSGNVSERILRVTAGGPEMLSGLTVTEDVKKK